MSEDDPHERDVTLAKERDENGEDLDEAEQARREAAEREREDEIEEAVESESEQRERAAREAENPDDHRDEEPHNS